MNETRQLSHVIFSLLTLVLLIVTLVFTGLSGGLFKGTIFLNSTVEISDKYRLEITPAGWTFTIWRFIYAFQVLFVAFLAYNMQIRSTISNDNIPRVYNDLMLAFYCVNLLCNIAWLMLFDRQQMVASFIFLIVLTVCLYAALVTHHILIKTNIEVLSRDYPYVFFATRVFIQNGLAIYATWVTISTLLNMGIVAAYLGTMTQSTASTLCLSFLIVEVLVYFILEVTIFEHYLRYTYLPWFVVIFVMAGIIQNNYVQNDLNSNFSLAILIISSFLFAIKTSLSVVFTFTKPIYGANFIE